MFSVKLANVPGPKQGVDRVASPLICVAVRGTVSRSGVKATLIFGT